MEQTIKIQNFKCSGCAATIRKGLSEIDGVSDVQVDLENSSVSLEADRQLEETIHAKLAQLGYPVENDPNSLMKQAKSYVSCMIGRVSGEEEK